MSKIRISVPKDKYHGYFKLSYIVFKDENEYYEFLEQLDKQFGKHVVQKLGVDIKKEKKKSVGKLTEEMKSDYDDLSISITETCGGKYPVIEIIGKGHRQQVWEFENFVRSFYDEERIISYYPWDNCQSMSDDFNDSTALRRQEILWKKEQIERLDKHGLLDVRYYETKIK